MEVDEIEAKRLIGRKLEDFEELFGVACSVSDKFQYKGECLAQMGKCRSTLNVDAFNFQERITELSRLQKQTILQENYHTEHFKIKSKRSTEKIHSNGRVIPRPASEPSINTIKRKRLQQQQQQQHTTTCISIHQTINPNAMKKPSWVNKTNEEGDNHVKVQKDTGYENREYLQQINKIKTGQSVSATSDLNLSKLEREILLKKRMNRNNRSIEVYNQHIRVLQTGGAKPDSVKTLHHERKNFNVRCSSVKHLVPKWHKIHVSPLTSKGSNELLEPCETATIHKNLSGEVRLIKECNTMDNVNNCMTEHVLISKLYLDEDATNPTKSHSTHNEIITPLNIPLERSVSAEKPKYYMRFVTHSKRV